MRDHRLVPMPGAEKLAQLKEEYGNNEEEREMKIERMKSIETLRYRDTYFEICYDGKLFHAIDHEYITDGRLNRPLNGLLTHADESLERCVKLATSQVDIEYYQSIGMSRAEAFSKALDIPLEIVEMAMSSHTVS